LWPKSPFTARWHFKRNTILRMWSGGVHTQHDKPLGVLDTLIVGLGVSQASNVDLVGSVNFVLGSVSDEDGLATPLDDDLKMPC
jgi:hypothetical protein